jgi:hypothetical protein
MKRNILSSAILATTFVLTACKHKEVDRSSVDKPSESSRDKVRDRDDIRGMEYETEQKTANFEKSINEKVARLDAKLVKIEARGDTKSRDTANELRARRDEIKLKVQQLGDSTEDSIDATESSIKSSWETLEQDVDSAL